MKIDKSYEIIITWNEDKVHSVKTNRIIKIYTKKFAIALKTWW